MVIGTYLKYVVVYCFGRKFDSFRPVSNKSKQDKVKVTTNF